MKKDDCFYLGKITSTSGLKGEVSIFIDSDTPHHYQGLDAMFLEIDESLVPFFIVWMKLGNGNKGKMRIEDIDSIDRAEELKGLSIYLPLGALPELSDPSTFYYHEVMNYDVVDAEMGKIGVLKEVWDNSAQDILVIDDGSGNEILLPIVDHFVKGADKEAKQINVTVPKDLIEMYTKGVNLSSDDDEQ